MDVEQELAQAYDSGLQRMKDKGELGGEHLDWVMAAAVLSARGNKQWPPAWAELTLEERLACRIIHEVSQSEAGVERYPKFLGEIATFECELLELRAAPLERRWLTGGLTPAATNQLTRVLGTVSPIVRRLQAEGIPPTAPAVSTQIDDFDWLEANPDPDLWHVIVCSNGLNWDTEAAERFVLWVVDQPSCDRATAAHLYASCTKGHHSEATVDGLSARLVAKISERAQRGDGFPRCELTLSEFGGKDDLRAIMGRVEAAPERLLGTPFAGRRTRTSYVFHSETVIQTGLDPG